MAFISDEPTDAVYTVEECAEAIMATVDFRDQESIFAGTKALRALANNRHFVLDAYHEELKSLYLGDSINKLTPQSIHFMSNDKFYIRSNIWLPPTKVSEFVEEERGLFTYNVAHDHNFNFMTVGYFSPGYTTSIYEYDYSTVLGFEGEDVDLRFLGDEKLIPGRTMVYRSSSDVHIQNEPSEPSISLNVMIQPDRGAPPQQFLFDLEKKKLIGGLTDEISTRVFLLDILAELHDEETVDIIHEVAKRSPCPRSQAVALQTLDKICPDQREFFRRDLRPEAARFIDHKMVHAGGYWSLRLGELYQ